MTDAAAVNEAALLRCAAAPLRPVRGVPLLSRKWAVLVKWVYFIYRQRPLYFLLLFSAPQPLLHLNTTTTTIIISTIMSPGLLILSLLLVCRAACGDDVAEVKTVLGADCVLPCTAVYKAGVQYLAIRWYKVWELPSPRRSGLLTRDLPNGTTRWYTAVQRKVELEEESGSIFLSNVTCADRGRYTCHLAAPVGEQNRDGEVVLTLTDCPDAPTERLASDTYLVIVAVAVLVLALAVFLISYVSLKNILRDKIKMAKKETLLSASLRPLDEKDFALIYTLGPKPKHSLEHVCV